MANYAYVENDTIVQLTEELPANWKNISNFCVFSDIEAQQYNWYKLVKVIPDYNPATQYIGAATHTFVNGVAYETHQILDIPQTVITPITPEQFQQQIEQDVTHKWIDVRAKRDKLMNDFQWRYSRYDRQIRLNSETTDNLAAMDAYMQALADITKQTDVYNIIWPEYTG